MSRTSGEDRDDLVAVLVRRLIPLLAVVVLLGAITRNAARRLENTDTYFHLRFGAEFLDSWSPRDPGHVHTLGQADWIPTQWASQLAMAAAEDWGGLAAVAWLAGALQVTLVLVVYLVARSFGSPLAAAIATIATILSTAEALSARPQVVSYLFVLLVTYAWLATACDRRPRWWLLAIAWAWPLLHGMWIVGIVIGAVGVLGMILDGERDRRILGKLSIIVAGSVVVAVLNPIGPRIYESLWSVGSRAEYFTEWQPPSLTSPLVFMLAGMIGATGLIWWRTGGTSWIHGLFLLLAAAWAFYALRTTPVAAAMAAPLFAQALQKVLPAQDGSTRRDALTVTVAAVAGLLALAFAVPQTADEPLDLAASSAETLDRLPAGTRVLNDWNAGGYLMWRYPELDFVMNGYADTFSPEQLERNRDMLFTKPGWDELVVETNAEYALLDPQSPLGYALMNSDSWQILVDDEELTLLERVAG